MATNPLVAVDATSSRLLERELLRSWDAYLADGRLEQVRVPIAESWRRSQALGVDPFTSRAPTLLADRRDVRERWEAHHLGTRTPLIRRWLRHFADDSDYVIIVSDSHGMVLWIHGDVKLRSEVADAWNTVEGALWSEAGAGTNAIGTALAAGDPVHVRSAEHFSEAVHAAACSAAPIHDPEDGGLLGVIDVTGPTSKLYPDSLAPALAAARAVEADLRAALQRRDARLRARYLERMASASGKLALVTRSGRVIADHPGGLLGGRRVEIPAAGDVLVLPGGRRGIAEPLDGEDGYFIRMLSETGGSGQHLQHARTSSVTSEVPGASGKVTEWHRAQLELTRLAEEQAALRRVATLVAGQGTAEEIFATVAEEVAQLLDADLGMVWRYEPDESMAVAAFWTTGDRTLPVGTRVELEGDSVAALVQRSGRPRRLDSYRGLSGPVIDLANSLGAGPRSTVGAPILAEGRVWGVIVATRTRDEKFADDTESRLVGFAELVATAISNAVTRQELEASRARIVAAADAERRRIERDLHDGAQQRLVTLVVALRRARAKIPVGLDELRADVDRVAEGLAAAVEELREMSRGIHPAVLTEGGLVPALKALGRRSAVPLQLDAAFEHRLPDQVEIVAYYTVSEAVTNASKHAGAAQMWVSMRLEHDTLYLSIRDDGVGGADPRRGSGLIGLADRIEAVGGKLELKSPPGRGTSIAAELPTRSDSSAETAPSVSHPG
jgi:signal transduction histidine kinase